MGCALRGTVSSKVFVVLMASVVAFGQRNQEIFTVMLEGNASIHNIVACIVMSKTSDWLINTITAKQTAYCLVGRTQLCTDSTSSTQVLQQVTL